MASIAQRTNALTLRERNVVFVSEMLVTALLRLTLMGPAEVQAVVDIVRGYAPDETDEFGTRLAHAKLLELLNDIRRDHASPRREPNGKGALPASKASSPRRRGKQVPERQRSRRVRRRSGKS